MASINVDLNYFGHIKTMRLVSRLGHGSEVLPIKLWAHVGKYSPASGSIAMLEAELEHCLGWWGEKGALATALVDCGFVTREGNTWFVHDWIVHSGHLAYFQERAIKAAQKRWGNKRKVSNASSNAKRHPKQCSCSSCSTILAITDSKLRFTPPTPTEVTAYAKEIGFEIDGHKFCDHYAAGGWKRGKTPITDWKACVRTWKGNSKGPDNQKNRGLVI